MNHCLDGIGREGGRKGRLQWLWLNVEYVTYFCFFSFPSLFKKNSITHLLQFSLLISFWNISTIQKRQYQLAILVFSHPITLALGKLHSNPRFPQYRKLLQLRGILHLTDYSTASSCALATRNTSTRNTLYKNKPADRVFCRRNMLKWLNVGEETVITLEEFTRAMLCE